MKVRLNKNMEKFKSEILKVEGKDASYIKIPFNVEEKYNAKRVKVKATFDGIEYKGSIVKMGVDCHILGITKAIRNSLNKTFGDIIDVTIEEDKEERIVEIPKEFKELLEKERKAKEFFETLSYSNKRKYILWITGAKKEETKIKRMNESILKLNSNIKIK
ncbi:YdeI/OmpD-associated family protein [Clostridium thermobutyricum]|uniref:YdeI/OmpD-associated family protein n=1 Tax=Clostridium thermobutyricum TaxID=29372 RepID=UPI003F51E107